VLRGAEPPLHEPGVVAALLVLSREPLLPRLPVLLAVQPDLGLWLTAAVVVELLFVAARLGLLARGRQRAAVAGTPSGSLCR
jgi:hypothetical protein